MSKFEMPYSVNDAELDQETPQFAEILMTQTGELRIGDGHTKGGVQVTANYLRDAYVYGSKKDTEVANTKTSMQRIILSTDGKTIMDVDSFTQMPCHNLRRCVQAWNGTSNKRETKYFLNAGNSNLKADGTAADLTGGDGDVMTKIPTGHYRLIKETDATTGHAVYKKLISDKPFPNSAPFPAFYISYGGDQLQDQFIGSFEGAVVDNVFRSVVGVKPTVNTSRANFRTKAAAGHATLCNWLTKVWLGWLMEIECADTDVQAAISLGFTELSAYDYAYIRKAGRTASLGNATGEIIADSEAPTITTQNQVFTRHPASDSGSAYAWEDGAVFVYTNSATPAVGDTAYTTAALTTSFGTISEKTDAGEDYDLEGHWVNGARKVVAFSYRGIENLWGSLWENDDGIQKYQIKSEADIYCTENGVAVKYDRHPDSDHKISSSPDVWAYAWFNATTETTIFTADERAAVNAATYSDNTLTTDRNLPVTAFDDDFRESGFWYTTDINQYSQLDSDRGYGAENAQFPAQGFTGPNICWVSQPWPKASGYIRLYDPLTYFPTAVGGTGSGATGFLADNFYNDTATGPRLVRRGGNASGGRIAGVFCVNVYDGLAHAWTYIGARLAAVEQVQNAA